MLEVICCEVRNFFLGDDPQGRIHRGTFHIESGTLTGADFLKEGQYFRIVGSDLNDGVYLHPAAGLRDECFAGAVWVMSVPPSFITLADDIKAFCASDAGKPHAFTSESFGGYSYTRQAGKNGGALTWQEAFAKDLNPYRRMRVI